MAKLNVKLVYETPLFVGQEAPSTQQFNYLVYRGLLKPSTLSNLWEIYQLFLALATFFLNYSVIEFEHNHKSRDFGYDLTNLVANQCNNILINLTSYPSSCRTNYQ
jgi:hypothetical protein